jgi:hypothetical protein
MAVIQNHSFRGDLLQLFIILASESSSRQVADMRRR